MFARIDAFVRDDRGQRAVAIAAVVVLVTAVASFGATPKRTSSDRLSTGSEPGATSEEQSSPASSATPGTDAASSGGPRTGGVASPGRTPNLAAIPPALRGVDFGLRTQGVTPKSVKVGFSGNFDNCGDTASLVQSLPPGIAGDPVKSINTFARYVNDHGGIGGRRYNPVIVQDGGSGCPDRNLPAAVKMADQEKVFLAVPGLHVESDYIIGRKVPVFGGRDDPASLRKYGPNGFALLEPITETIDAWASFGRHHLKTTDKGGASPGCLIRISNGASGNWDYPQKRLRADMARYGIKFVDEYTFKDDIGSAQEQANAIAIRERDKGCQHVYFLAGNFIGLIFVTDAATKNRWFPKKWTWTGYTYGVDDDRFAKTMDQVQWENAEGLTYRLPPGASPFDGNCRRIYESYNGNDGNGESASVKIACGSVLTTAEIMRRGVRLTGRLDANSFVLGANAIRDDFFFDSHVPMAYSVPSSRGPFQTRAWRHYTVAEWSASQSRYLFPKYPCYYKTFGPNNAGCEDLRRFYRK